MDGLRNMLHTQSHMGVNTPYPIIIGGFVGSKSQMYCEKPCTSWLMEFVYQALNEALNDKQTKMAPLVKSCKKASSHDYNKNIKHNIGDLGKNIVNMTSTLFNGDLLTEMCTEFIHVNMPGHADVRSSIGDEGYLKSQKNVPLNTTSHEMSYEPLNSSRRPPAEELTMKHRTATGHSAKADLRSSTGDEGYLKSRMDVPVNASSPEMSYEPPKSNQTSPAERPAMEDRTATGHSAKADVRSSIGDERHRKLQKDVPKRTTLSPEKSHEPPNITMPRNRTPPQERCTMEDRTVTGHYQFEIQSPSVPSECSDGSYIMFLNSKPQSPILDMDSLPCPAVQKIRFPSECSLDSTESCDSFIVFEEQWDVDEFDENDDTSDDDFDVYFEDPVRLSDVNTRWNVAYECDKSDCEDTQEVETARHVRFSDKVEVHVMRVWDFAYRQARLGPWEQIARDRVRFHDRIARLEPVLSRVLTPTHRRRAQKRALS